MLTQASVNKIFRVFLVLVLHVQPLQFRFSKINLSEKWLVPTSYGFMIELSRNEKLQK